MALQPSDLVLLQRPISLFRFIAELATICLHICGHRLLVLDNCSKTKLYCTAI